MQINISGSDTKPFIIMYHGLLTINRGIEKLIQLTSINPNILSVILGNGDEGYIKELKE